jgi:hypothetical protein
MAIRLIKFGSIPSVFGFSFGIFRMLDISHQSIYKASWYFPFKGDIRLIESILPLLSFLIMHG